MKLNHEIISKNHKEIACVYTVYDTENCGSFLQAYALQTVLEKYGIEVVFSNSKKIKNHLHSISFTLITVIKRILKFRFREAEKAFKKYSDFHKIQRESFWIMNDDAIKMMDISCVIVGSDTIWNFDDEFFYGNREIYLAMAWDKINKISYAASVGNTTFDTFAQIEQIKDRLLDFNMISVRDQKTAQAVKRITGIEPTSVCDPTFLLEQEEYEKFIIKKPKREYIFVYYFGVITLELRRYLSDYAKINEVDIVIMEHHNEKGWCENVDLNPANFLTYMKYAKYVVTDTFHGAVFSIIYDKQFVVINQGKNKVQELLESFGISERLCTDSELKRKLDEKIEYEDIRKKINIKRATSYAYLQNALGVQYES